ncbi:hypothetical protein LJC46_10050 [Desulfovibrio sp. OttesenSCG-928-G15]|nr:hypothetical protein [Desulfovibrio sp. OttesenSCG-928-G15]
MTWVEICVSITGIIFLALLMVLALFFVKACLDAKREEKAWEQNRSIFISECWDIIRWCGYEFPQVEDVCRYFIAHLKGESRPTVDGLRADLRRKYPDQEVDRD